MSFFSPPHIESSILPNTSLTQAITVKYSNLDFCFLLWLLVHWAPCLLLDSVTSDIYHCRDRPCQEHFGFRQKTKIDALQKWSKGRYVFDYCLSPQPLKKKKKKILPFERITWIPWEAWKHIRRLNRFPASLGPAVCVSSTQATQFGPRDWSEDARRV